MGTITINGMSYTGNSIKVKDGAVIIDDVEQEQLPANTVTLKVEGTLVSLQSDKSVTCGDVQGNVEAGMSVKCSNVGGDVNSQMSVTCNDVHGSVTSGMSVKCNSIKGSCNDRTVNN